MFAEGESELRDLVVHNLESCGFLNKIKAELRAGVFLALSDEGSLKKKVPLYNKKLDDFVQTKDGKLAVSIVREFLEYFNLNFTLSVFDPEVSSSSPYVNRKNLCEDFDINESELEGDILSALLKKISKLYDLNPLKNEEKKSGDKIFLDDQIIEKGTLSSVGRNASHFFDEKNEISKNSKPDDSLFSTNNRDFFKFSNPEEKDIFKDQSIDHFFDDPVPSEETNLLSLSSTTELNDQKSLSSSFLTTEKLSAGVPNDQKKLSSAVLTSKEKSAPYEQKYFSSAYLTSEKESADQKKLSTSFVPSEKGSLSSLEDLPALTKQDNNKKSRLMTFGNDILADAPLDTLEGGQKKNSELNEEYSDRQINSEESIEEEIDEEFSAGLDDLLNSSLSLGDDATSDQTISQTSVVEGVDHVESCNTVN